MIQSSPWPVSRSSFVLGVTAGSLPCAGVDHRLDHCAFHRRPLEDASTDGFRRRLDVGGGLMSPAERWRPLVVGTIGSLTEAIYGLILATSVIAVSREYDSSNAGLIGVTVLVTGVVFWLAHVYARVLAASITRHRMLNRSEVREALRHDWPLVEVTVPLVLILALGALDIVPDKAASLAAMLAALVELAAAGAYAARRSGAGLRGTVGSAVIAVALGSAVVLLKALVH